MKMNWFEKLGVNSPIHTIELRKAARLLLKLGGTVSDGRVLEIGCGRGLGVELIFDLFSPSYVEAFEFDPDQIRLAKKRLLPRFKDRVNLFEASATEIPSPDSNFDAVFDFGVLHHIPNNQVAISEIARVLKPGGRFFFQELFSHFTMGALMRFLAHHPPEAQFTWEELSMKLSDSGLVVSGKSCITSISRVVGVGWKNTYNVK